MRERLKKELDKFYRLFSQELVGALKLEESILIPSSLHIYSQFFNQIGYGSDAQRLAAQMGHLMSVLGVRAAAVATGFLSTILEDREGLFLWKLVFQRELMVILTPFHGQENFVEVNWMPMGHLIL